MPSLVIRKNEKGDFYAYYVVSNGGKKQWIKRGKVLNRKVAQAEFKAWERNFEKEAFTGKPTNCPTLAEFEPEYLKYATGRTISGLGIQRAVNSIKHLKRILGTRKLAEITPSIVDSYVTRRKTEVNSETKKAPAPKTINIEVTQLSSIMTTAVQLNVLETHPFRSEKRNLASYFLKVERKIPTVLMPEEINAMYQLTKDHPHGLTVFLFLLLTGMRKGELSSLKWEHVNLTGKKITFFADKTDEPRTIPLSDALVDLLTYMQTHWPDHHKGVWKRRTEAQMTYVFCNEEGKAFGNQIGYFLPQLALKAGLRKHVTPHVLRHSFAAYGRSNFTGFQLQKLLGHKSITTTERYGLLLDAGIRESSNKLASSMGFQEVKSLLK